MRRLTAILLLSLMIVSSVEGLQLMKVTKADSKTIIVPDDYSSIQAAIDNSVSGDTIYVKSGTYVENPIINKSVALIGQGRDSTIIDVTAGLKVQSDNVTITGLTIFDGYDGISLYANYCAISENKIKQATHGIVVIGNSNHITGNTFESIGLSSAIQLNYANENLIKSNNIESCIEGIQIWQNSNNNTITENTLNICRDTAINFQYSTNNKLIGNTITNSGLGTSIYGSNHNSIYKNNYINNTIQLSANETYYLTWGNPRSVNTISENYWSNYNGTDSNNDAIGDTPYIIDDYNQDNQPKMFPISAPIELPISNPSPSVPEFSWWVIVPLLVCMFLVALVLRLRRVVHG